MVDPDLSRKSRQLLRIVNRKSPEVSTKDLTRESEYPNYTVRDHISPLIEEGFVDHVGWKDVDAPQEAKVYSITEAGKEHAEKVLGELQHEAKVEGVDGAEVRELREEVAELRRRDEVRLDQIDELKEQVEKHEAIIKKARSKR